MMTMPISLSDWAVAALVLAYVWPAALAITLGLVLWASLKRGRTRGIWIAAAVLPTVYAVVAAVVGVQSKTPEWKQSRLDRMARPISQSRELHGAMLPAGTRILWNDASQESFSEVKLPGTSQVLGVPLSGSMSYGGDSQDLNDPGHYWTGTLAAQAVIDGWTCVGGIELERNRHLHRCTLDADRVFGGHKVPAGSAVVIGPDGVKVTLTATMPVAEIGSALPGGSEVRFDANGCVREAGVREDTPVKVHGVALWSDALRLHSGAAVPGRVCAPVAWVRGNLVRDVAGSDAFTQGVEVDVDVRTGKLRAVRVGDAE